MKQLPKYLLFIFFILFLLTFGLMTQVSLPKTESMAKQNETKRLSLFQTDQLLKEKIQKKEEAYTSNFYKKTDLAETYGLIQRTLGKRLVDDPVPFRRVYRGEGETLYYVVPQKDINDQAVENVAKLKKTLDQEEIPLLFLIAPNKHTLSSTNFPRGAIDYSLANLDDLARQLKGRGVDVINLNEAFQQDGLDEQTSFYKTDTHWKNQTAFWAHTKLLRHLTAHYSYQMANEEATHLTNYKEEIYPDSYIGSMGKRVGQNYVREKDDYYLYLPKFKTNLTYRRFNENLEESGTGKGTFEEVFVDRQMLKSKDPYDDKYTAMMGYGFPYEIIMNNDLQNDTSVLLIKDSFAMPFSAYLSNNVQNTYLLDTRVENIRNNLRTLITDANPDYVIFVCSSTSIFYFPEMFDF